MSKNELLALASVLEQSDDKSPFTNLHHWIQAWRKVQAHEKALWGRISAFAVGERKSDEEGHRKNLKSEQVSLVQQQLREIDESMAAMTAYM